MTSVVINFNVLVEKELQKDTHTRLEKRVS